MTASANDKQWFGQPAGLTILFLTEMWEKFSYYGMRALLVYYMTKELLIPQQRASLIYGLYTALVYFTPIAGGVIADRWLGRRRSVVIGGTIMALGHFMLASEHLFYAALATIIIGNGLYLPSLPGQIAGLYEPSDPRRGSAYNVYYVGVNLGAFLSPLLCGALGELYGWHWGFGAAGLGMLCGLVIYVKGLRWLPPDTVRAPVAVSQSPPDNFSRNFGLLAAVVLIVVIFRGAYEQLGNTVALWADAGVDRTIGSGLWIPMTWFQSLNPLLVFIITPLLLAQWARAAARGREISSLTKMAIGAGIVAASYFMLAAVSGASLAHGTPASWLWLVAFFVVMTAGELYILPVGLSLFGQLAPPRLAATLIAMWFFAGFAGNLLAGTLGTLWSRMTHPQFFALIGSVAALSGLLLRLLDRPMRAMQRSVRDSKSLQQSTAWEDA